MDKNDLTMFYKKEIIKYMAKINKAKRIQLDKRDRKIYRLHTNPETALTCEELGNRFGLTRQRIGQIVIEQEQKILNKQSA